MSVSEQGYELMDNLLAPDEVEQLLGELSRLQLPPLRGGIRRIEQLVPRVAELANSPRLLEVAAGYLPGNPQLVRAIYFDKSPANNWYVTWHQDQTVTVSERFEDKDWGPWSMKAGAWHVQPPLRILDEMITVRIHLDPATVANGCLKVIPGSHHFGLIDVAQVTAHVAGNEVIYCESPAGGAVVMRPHILHASEKAIAPAPRRILHLEYSSCILPQGIAWSA